MVMKSGNLSTYAEHEGKESENVGVEEEVVAPLANNWEGECIEDVGADDTNETSLVLRLSEFRSDLAFCVPFVHYISTDQVQRQK